MLHLQCINENIALDDYEKISKLLDEIKIEFKKIDGVQKVYLNGKDVSLEIRTKPVNENVSPVSTIKIVRERLAKLQREMAETIDVIMEGRDIGTNVFPNANVKILFRLQHQKKEQEEDIYKIKKMELKCHMKKYLKV